MNLTVFITHKDTDAYTLSRKKVKNILLSLYWPPAKRRSIYFWPCLSVCLSLYVCMYVCLSDSDFWKPWRRNFILAHPAYLQEIRLKLVYEGHRAKVKVAGAKKVDNHPVFTQRKPACQQKSGSPQCEHSVANNSSSITHRAVKCASSIGFSATTDRMVVWHFPGFYCSLECYSMRESKQGEQPPRGGGDGATEAWPG